MLSILIPNFNYNATLLVQNIWNQIKIENVPFEIIILDDGSDFYLEENQKLNALDNCQFIKNDKNLGRSKTRNLLISYSQYNWILFLDSDTLPTTNLFIKKYIQAIHADNNICFGGIAYLKEKPEINQILRWEYGKNREQIAVNIREKNPYKYALVSNILLEKSKLQNLLFNELITEYGYEDVVFFDELEKKKQRIWHIDNTVYHLNYESSKVFLEKTKTSLKNLKFLNENQILDEKKFQIGRIYNWITIFNLKKIVSFLFRSNKVLIEKNLLSRKPSLFLLDCYKLGFYCKIK